MTPVMTPEVVRAVEQVRKTCVDYTVTAEPECQGGAYVIVTGVPVGGQYTPCMSWVGFLIPYLYPHGDVYPHFLDGALRRTDGSPLGAAFSGVMDWRGRPAVQVSRKSNCWNPATDTAAGKLLKVLDWVRSR